MAYVVSVMWRTVCDAAECGVELDWDDRAAAYRWCDEHVCAEA